MSKAWAPWLLPAALLVAIGIAVGLRALGVSSAIVAVVLLALGVAGPIYLRVNYLKQNPPDPELIHKPWWVK